MWLGWMRMHMVDHTCARRSPPNVKICSRDLTTRAPMTHHALRPQFHFLLQLNYCPLILPGQRSSSYSNIQRQVKKTLLNCTNPTADPSDREAEKKLGFIVRDRPCWRNRL
ncbi:hypothetical protein AAC387_Pa05g0507 [Persea americana]